jgi:amidase
MVDDALHWKTAAELAESFRRREVSPVEAVEAAIARMDAVQPQLNIMVTPTRESARAAAKDAEARFRAGDQLPPLFGVPVTVKDLVETAGVRTTYGSVAYADFTPDFDAIGWARLKAQGAILLGKTTTPEFGLLGVTESKLTGSTSTPWRAGYAAGGSSGGAAAAVVSGVGPIAWGSDGGGSIRVPSSLCGAVGIKPSIGRVPTLDSVDGDNTDGPIARTVLDAALVLDATAGHHPGDRFSVPREDRSYSEAARVTADMTGMRIAVCYDLGQKVVDPGVRAVVAQATDDMVAAGAIVEEVAIDLPDPTEFFDRINGPEYAEFVAEMSSAGVELWPMIGEIAGRGRQVTGLQVSAAFRRGKSDIYRAFTGALEGFDALVTPTTPVAAFPSDGDYGPSIMVDGQKVPPLGMFIHTMTEAPSHAGLPAISVPCGFTAEGLPVGLQLIGALWSDAHVITTAAKYEALNEWHRHHPVLESRDDAA